MTCSLLLRDTAKQVQDIATLSRDVEHANNALSPIFNKEKKQKCLKQAQLIGEIGAQMMDIVRTEGELKAQKAAEAKGDATVERPKEGDPAKKWEVYKKALTESPTYKAEMKKYGTGSDFQRAAQAATAAIQALAGGDIQKAIASGAQSGRNAVENNFFGKALVEGCAIAAPCRTKVAEKLLELGVKAGITGVVAKEIADNLSSEELDHLIRLNMMGNDEITVKYLNSLQDKYLPSHTGGDQTANTGLANTGGDQTTTGNVPTHTGNNQSSGEGATNTGNTDGKPDTGGNTTVTPIPDGPSKDDLAYLDKITQGEHASIRNKEGRPVGSVINDVQKSRPADILIQDDGRWVVKGNGGKVHVIESDGEVVTSFYNPKANTDSRVRKGEWSHPSNEQLEQFKQKFSDYVKW
ncbi:VENN motif pre-toxin domain-containing protein [Pectobacterium polaris]|uniref:VENN motif pre-toxin domain-containing protein n=1 Tax=Pectobacterium polaris TaxID=2042057 RepID=UPI0020C70ACD|nr:VENN motif pre-toxin domain-containing protein [Pectobacterium polaris]